MAIDFTNLVRIFDAYGVTEFLLPFFLIFTILYAILLKVKLLSGNKKFQVLVAFILTFLVLVPHITGNYPAGYDPINVINEILPSIALFAVAALLLFILLGVFGLEELPGWGKSIGMWVSIGFVVYLLGSSLGWWTDPGTIDLFSWWTDDLSELLLIMLVFGLIAMFITKGNDDQPGRVGTAVDKFLTRIGLGKT